jgi:hypothetical protein
MLNAVVIGGAIGFCFQLGFYISWFAGGSFGYEFFSFAAFWPLGILSLFFSDAMPSWLEFPVLNLFSLAGWSLLTVICMSPFYFISCCRKQRIENEKPVA